MIVIARAIVGHYAWCLPRDAIVGSGGATLVIVGVRGPEKDLTIEGIR